MLFGIGSEFLDDRIRNEAISHEATSLPVLVEIPPLPTPSGNSRRPLAAVIGSGGHRAIIILHPGGILRLLLGIVHV